MLWVALPLITVLMFGNGWQIVEDYARKDAVNTRGQTDATGRVGLAASGASACHRGLQGTGRSAGPAILTWPPMETLPSALKLDFAPSLPNMCCSLQAQGEKRNVCLCNMYGLAQTSHQLILFLLLKLLVLVIYFLKIVVCCSVLQCCLRFGILFTMICVSC